MCLFHLKKLIYGDLAFCSSCWQKNMSGKWYHWCMLSPAEWENCDHEKGDMWTIQSIKYNLEKQRINLNMISSEKKNVYCQYYLIQFQ